jgi:ammonia channel protein AmtB
MLWVSWLFFNSGSSQTMFVERKNGPAKIVMNTIISGAVGGIIAQFFKPRLINSNDYYDITGLCNGILSGLVSITAVCHDVDP